MVLDLSVTHNSWTCNWVQIPEGLSNLSLSLFFLFAWPFVELGLNCGYKLMVFVCEITSTWAYSGSTEMRCCTHIYFKNSLIRISLTSVFHQKYESQEEKAVFRIDIARTRTTSPYICYSLNARLHKHEWGVYNRSHMCIWIHTHFQVLFCFPPPAQLFLLPSKFLPVLFHANNITWPHAFFLSSPSPELDVLTACDVTGTIARYRGTVEALGVSEEETNHIHMHPHIYTCINLQV